MGIPLTSKAKAGSWFVNFELLDVRQTAVISQARSLSVFRLYNKIGELPKDDFARIKKELVKLYQ